MDSDPRPANRPHGLRTWRRLVFPVVVLVSMLVLARLKLSGTSVGIYHIIFNGENLRDAALVAGQPRVIRTDEWMVHTPWIASQVRSGLAQVNPYYLPSQNLALMNVPVRHWITVFRPALWPFFVLPIEEAFALSWCIDAALLLVSSYWVLMWITRQNAMVSAMGASSLLWSPYLQWWYAGPAGLLDIASFAMLSCLLAGLAVRASRLWHRFVWGVLCAYFLACFGLVLYPPAQIPVALLCGLVGIAAAMEHHAPLALEHRVRAATVIAGSVLAATLVMLTFGLEFRELVRSMWESVYPGQRRMETGGTISLVQLLAGVYDAFLLRGQWPPSLGANQSEISSFFMLSLAVVPFLIVSAVHKRQRRASLDLVLLASLLALGLLLTWMLFGLPRFISRVLLLEFVPPGRAWLAAGLANFLIVYYYLSRGDFLTSARFRVWAWFAAGGYVRGSLVCRACLDGRRTHIPKRSGRACGDFGGGSAAGAPAASEANLRVQRTAVVLLAGIRGTRESFVPRAGPLLRSEFGQAIRRINSQDTEPATWMVYDLDLGDFLAANGARVLGGTWAYPKLNFWHKFDPSAMFQPVYNRFGHVIFVQPQGPESPSFRIRSVDVIEVELDACQEILRTLGVKYYVFFRAVQEPCLTPIEDLDLPGTSIHVYQRLP